MIRDPEPGMRVQLVGSHSHAGEHGEIVAGPGAFNGWAVRLDPTPSGFVATVGVGPGQMRLSDDPVPVFTVRVGDRCPGCHVVCASLDSQHTEHCPYVGRVRLLGSVVES